MCAAGSGGEKSIQNPHFRAILPLGVIFLKKILVVEDEEDIQELLCTYLCDAGYEVSAACDGVQAIEKFHRGAFDLVLLDIIRRSRLFSAA